MDETVIVIMLKDKKTGFLEKELGSYKIEENEEFIYNAYALEEGDGYMVVLRLTVDRDVEDWQFEAIYDYYDFETILPFVTSIEEEEECYNPTWRVTFPFIETEEEMEEKISTVLALHRKELDSVWEAIADKKEEYTTPE